MCPRHSVKASQEYQQATYGIAKAFLKRFLPKHICAIIDWNTSKRADSIAPYLDEDKEILLLIQILLYHGLASPLPQQPECGMGRLGGSWKVAPRPRREGEKA
ncbi:MAG: hypothetical protein AAF400_01855 [Bacteroidota bacterium]